MANRLEFQSANFAEEFDALLASKREVDSDVHDAVAAIIVMFEAGAMQLYCR